MTASTIGLGDHYKPADRTGLVWVERDGMLSRSYLDEDLAAAESHVANYGGRVLRDGDSRLEGLLEEAVARVGLEYAVSGEQSWVVVDAISRYRDQYILRTADGASEDPLPRLLESGCELAYADLAGVEDKDALHSALADGHCALSWVCDSDDEDWVNIQDLSLNPWRSFVLVLENCKALSASNGPLYSWLLNSLELRCETLAQVRGWGPDSFPGEVGPVRMLVLPLEGALAAHLRPAEAPPWAASRALLADAESPSR